MGFWGWRQAAWAAFISVFVVACVPSAPTPTPTSTPAQPRVTLTLQIETGTPQTTTRPTLIAVTATPERTEPAPVEVLAPQCADTATDGYQCVGLIRNLTSNPRGTILLRAALHSGGEIIEARTVALEQRLVAPEGEAPYRLLFDGPADGPLILDVSGDYAPEDGLVALVVRENAGEAGEGDGYLLTALVVNPHPFEVREVRAVAALYSGAELIGYRVQEIESLEAGGEYTLSMRWHALKPGALHHTLAVDAYGEGE